MSKNIITTFVKELLYDFEKITKLESVWKSFPKEKDTIYDETYENCIGMTKTHSSKYDYQYFQRIPQYSKIIL